MYVLNACNVDDMLFELLFILPWRQPIVVAVNRMHSRPYGSFKQIIFLDGFACSYICFSYRPVINTLRTWFSSRHQRQSMSHLWLRWITLFRKNRACSCRLFKRRIDAILQEGTTVWVGLVRIFLPMVPASARCSQHSSVE